MKVLVATPVPVTNVPTRMSLIEVDIAVTVSVVPLMLPVNITVGGNATAALGDK
jgi:hypothetical protein